MSYKIDKPSSLLLDCDYIPSVNCDPRTDPDDISLIVVHGISLPPGEFGGPYIEHLFTNTLDTKAHDSFKRLEGLAVSSHLLIRREGEVIQFVPFEKRAWHAGVSSHKGREGCNDYSIGIELEGSDELAYEQRQYQQLAAVIVAIFKAFPATNPPKAEYLSRVVGHSDIAPGRKTDPGPAFDWLKLSHVLTDSLG